MDTHEETLLQAHARHVAHMRAERQTSRFGLVLGAGASLPLGFPGWADLVGRIADHESVQGRHVIEGVGLSLPDTSKTQMLFQHFHSKSLETANEVRCAKVERRIQGDWRRVIRECLYRDVPKTASEIRDRHPYIRDFIDIVATSPLTVNYNFDDTIQQLMQERKPAEGSTAMRNFETVSSANLPFRAKSAIMLHPNGYLPNNLLEFPTDRLVFSEDSFADQLIESMAGHHASLLHHFSKTTCLFIGISLQDGTLRHLLRQNAVINPGHHHYYVHWRKAGAVRDEHAEQALREANFEVYNLVTLFLDDPGIGALGRLIAMPEEVLVREAEEAGAGLEYCYYLVGAIGAGKTTCLSYLGSFETYEEWSEQRPEALARPWPELKPDERIELDTWIARQFYLKNAKLFSSGIGIDVADRSPLDPLSFAESAEQEAKAAFMISTITPRLSKRRIKPGHILHLRGDPEDMEARVIGRHKQSSATLIADMQAKMTALLSGTTSTTVDTFGSSIHQVVKRVSRAILLDPYQPVELTDVLEAIARKPCDAD